jgi:hypothetical protein
MSYFEEHNIKEEDAQPAAPFSEEQILELIAQEFGTTQMLRAGRKPPTNKSVLRELEVEYFDKKKHTCHDCPICQEDYELGDALFKLPCKHRMHKKCLKSWLETNNSCPMCRHELLTDDPDYELEKLERNDTHRKKENQFSIYM